MLRPSPYCDAVSQRDETKTIKPIINEAFVAFSGDIITGYNELYRLFMHHIASRRVNITMSAFVIGQTASPGHGGSNEYNKIHPLFLRIRLGGVMQIFQHRDVDMWGVFKRAVLGACGQVLTFIKNISLGLRL